jgi:hypothetical protein
VRVEFSHDHTRRGDDINTVQICPRSTALFPPAIIQESSAMPFMP